MLKYNSFYNKYLVEISQFLISDGILSCTEQFYKGTGYGIM